MATLLQYLIGVPLLLAFAGILSHDVLPDWMVARRVQGSRTRYYLLTYAAFVLIIPVLYFGGQFIRANDLGPSMLVTIVAIPLAFALKYTFLKIARIKYTEDGT